MASMTIYEMAASCGWYYEASDDTWQFKPKRADLAGHFRRVANSRSFQESLAKTYHELKVLDRKIASKKNH